ncbi:helix-turn-helix domain-containing protein [Treponema primitia]|uniref:helix-turn-helix domain-containing protein n=1 Tax=Treponema primitia TaxID=88058 RepID=UPI00025556E3|nr:AraC family transcriptional regulator [Treponema primitia]
MEIRDIVFVYHMIEDERIAWHGRYHTHGQGEHEIAFFLDGSGVFLCNKNRYPIGPNKFFISAEHEFHSIIPNRKAKSPITFYAILFYVGDGDRDLMDLVASVFTQGQKMLTVNSAYRFQCEDIAQLWKSGDPSLGISAKYLLQSLLYRVYQNVAVQTVYAGQQGGAAKTMAREDDAPKSYKTNKTSSVHVTKAVAIMQTNLRKSISVDEIARLMTLSTEHFSRIFRAETGMSPHQYFIRLKVEAASGLLMSSAKTISQIADWFGFENQFHFSRVFKRCTGMSPLQYRKTYVQTVDFVTVEKLALENE